MGILHYSTDNLLLGDNMTCRNNINLAEQINRYIYIYV